MWIAKRAVSQVRSRILEGSDQSRDRQGAVRRYVTVIPNTSAKWILSLVAIPGLLASQTLWDQHFSRGETLERAGKYADAAEEFTAALEEAERLDPDGTRLPLTLHNLGAVHRELGLNSDAERDYQRAISLWQNSRPARPLDLASSLSNLAALNLVLGRLSRAETLYRRGYDLRRANLPPNHARIGSSLIGLAQVAHTRRQYPEAEDLYRQAAAIVETSAGPASPALADVSHNWALLYRDMHRDDQARPLLERSQAIYEKANPNHPKLAIVLRNLAELNASAGDPAAADRLFVRAVAICDAALPADHPQTGIILQAYGSFLTATGRKKEARPIADRARAIVATNARQSGTAYTVDASAFAGK